MKNGTEANAEIAAESEYESGSGSEAEAVTGAGAEAGAETGAKAVAEAKDGIAKKGAVLTEEDHSEEAAAGQATGA